MTALLRSSKELLVKRFFKKADVLLTVCTHRNLSVEAMSNVMHLFGEGRHNFVWAPVVGEALIDRARSRAASWFLSRKEDVLVFLDDDVGFQAEDMVKLVDNVMGGMDICAGMYVQKNENAGKNVVLFDGQEVTFSKDAEPVEVEAVNTGFLAISRRVFEQMAKQGVVPLCHVGNGTFFPFFQPFPAQKAGKWVYLSEDWAFCERARAMGFKVWLDPSIFLTHEGPYKYDLGDQLRPPKAALGSVSVTIR